MIVGAHQPNFLPWIGFFHKLNLCEKFILADDVQFTKHGFTNRVLIKTSGEAMWLTIPVLTTGKGNQNINELRIEHTQDWQRKQWKLLYHNYKSAPFFEHYADFFEGVYRKEWKFLIDLNLHLLKFLIETLGIPSDITLSSKFEVPQGPTDRIIGLVKQAGGTTYLSGSSGRKYLEEEQFIRSGISLEYVKFKHPEYRQQFNGFIPKLSVIDLLFNEGPASVDIIRKSTGDKSGSQTNNESH